MPKPLNVMVDRTSPVPLYHQLAEQWAAAIKHGNLKAGDPFENELALVARLRLSRPTIRKAMDELVRQGLLVRRRGVGTHVANQLLHSRDNLTSLYEELDATGRQPRTEVLLLKTGVTNSTIATAMGLDQQTALVRVERLRYCDNRPLVILRSWLPPRFEDITMQELTHLGLRQILAQRGAVVAAARQRAAARIASVRERRLLLMTRADAVMHVQWQGFSADGTTLEYGEHSYRGDSFILDNMIRST
ncbi:MAG: GntR family transcriptional regulator [Propionibacteriaceae bacterium]